MAKIQQSITIIQPVEQVFAFVRDTRNTTRWHPSLTEARATLEGPAQVGTQITEVRTFIGRKMVSTFEIVEMEPNKRIVMKSKIRSISSQSHHDVRVVGKCHKDYP